MWKILTAIISQLEKKDKENYEDYLKALINNANDQGKVGGHNEA